MIRKDFAKQRDETSHIFDTAKLLESLGCTSNQEAPATIDSIFMLNKTACVIPLATTKPCVECDGNCCRCEHLVHFRRVVFSFAACAVELLKSALHFFYSSTSSSGSAKASWHDKKGKKEQLHNKHKL